LGKLFKLKKIFNKNIFGDLRSGEPSQHGEQDAKGPSDSHGSSSS
jgi:hypothetical protein